MNREPPLIDTKTASITTCTITVQAMTINNKQVTLALFKQLPTRRPIALDCLNLWGIVNYYVDYQTRWAVGEQEGVLYRVGLIGPTSDVDCPMTLAEAEAQVKWCRSGSDGRQIAQAQRWVQDIKALEENNDLIGTLPQLFIAV